MTGIEELAALIESQGLLQNLVVTEQVGRGGKGRVRFAVVAGERRRRALLLLQERCRLPKTHAVPCELVPPERALEISVAENSGREAMHPADEFEAFSAMIAEGKGIEDVAARFGLSPLTVQRRLKLASVSPKLLALYRQDGINLDQLMALTLTGDHAAQESTWEDTPHWDRSPTSLRRRLTAADIAIAGSALVRFVGVEAYELGGGAVRRDLFDGAETGYLVDGELLRRLAMDKLEALCGPVRGEGWSWVEARLELDSPALRQFAPCDSTLRAPTPDERSALAEMMSRETELDAETQAMQDSDGWNADHAERIDLEEQDIAARRAAIQEARRTWEPEARARSGASVTIGRHGDAEIIRGLMRAADQKAFAAASRRGRNVGAGRASATSPAVPNKAAYSEALKRRLTAHRTAALQATLARNPSVALVALVHALVQRVFGSEHGGVNSALQITALLPTHDLIRAADDLEASRAWTALAADRDKWIARLPAARAALMAFLSTLAQDELLDLLAHCVGCTVNAASARGGDDADALATALALDMADWWEPTAKGFLSHTSKAQVVEAMREGAPGSTDDGVAELKKDALVAKAALHLAGKRWLPEPLRRQPLV